MNLYLTVRALECLRATSLLRQTLEFLRLSRFADARSVWSWPLQRGDVAHTAVWLQKLFDWLFQERVHQAHLLLRLGAAASLYVGVSMVSAIFLFASSLIILIRIAWRAGLWYITIHAISSYFISGAIKLISSDWRSGRVLIHFLDGGLYGPLLDHSLFRKKPIAVIASWSFIVWECMFPLALAGPQWAMLWCAIAAFFHFLVFRFFGLNRFFWAWAASFPAIIYCSTQW